MPKIDELIINFSVFEDAVEYLGMSEATLPEVSNLAEEITGAGIAGNVEAVVLGHIEAMTLTLNFRTVTKAAIRLAEPRIHNIDLRAAQQVRNTQTGKIETVAAKHIMKVTPKKFAPGKLAAASAADFFLSSMLTIPVFCASCISSANSSCCPCTTLLSSIFFLLKIGR